MHRHYVVASMKGINNTSSLALGDQTIFSYSTFSFDLDFGKIRARTYYCPWKYVLVGVK